MESLYEAGKRVRKHHPYKRPPQPQNQPVTQPGSLSHSGTSIDDDSITTNTSRFDPAALMRMMTQMMATQSALIKEVDSLKTKLATAQTSMIPTFYIDSCLQCANINFSGLHCANFNYSCQHSAEPILLRYRPH